MRIHRDLHQLIDKRDHFYRNFEFLGAVIGWSVQFENPTQNVKTYCDIEVSDSKSNHKHEENWWFQITRILFYLSPNRIATFLYQGIVLSPQIKKWIDTFFFDICMEFSAISSEGMSKTVHGLKTSLSMYRVNCAKDKWICQVPMTRTLWYDFTSSERRFLSKDSALKKNSPKPAKMNISAENVIWSFRIIISQSCG